MQEFEEMNEGVEELLNLLQSLEDATFKLEQMIKHTKPTLLNETFITDEELSKLLKVNRRTLQKWRTEGLVEYIQLGGGKVIYASSAIEALLAKNIIPAWTV